MTTGPPSIVYQLPSPFSKLSLKAGAEACAAAAEKREKRIAADLTERIGFSFAPWVGLERSRPPSAFRPAALAIFRGLRRRGYLRWRRRLSSDGRSSPVTTHTTR